MRICLYTETALPKVGGQELVIDALARQFLALGHEPVVLSPPPKRRRVVEHDAQLPYPVVRHPRFVSTRYLVDWYATFLRRASRRYKFDVLHCHSIYPCAYLAALCKDQLRIPLVITSHGGDVHSGGRRLAKPGLPERYARALAAADALVSISRFTTAGYQRLFPSASNIEAIPNGVHVEPYATCLPRPKSLSVPVSSGEYILFLGRLNQRKGVDVLLEAVAQIPAGVRVPLVVAGDGPERAALAARCQELRLAQVVHFAGPVSGAAKTWLLQNASFTVMPSRTWEAFPLVVLESFAAGKPVVATSIPGLVDLVEPRRTGLLVPPESARELADAMSFLLMNKAVAEAYGHHARQIAQEFDWRNIAQAHLDLYARLRSAPREEQDSVDDSPPSLVSRARFDFAHQWRAGASTPAHRQQA